MSGNKAEKVGSVLVVGSGIAGMQASLDLASSGYLVNMVTDSPSVGGKMTQLDKTFPTNECAMCLLGPRMTDTLNHPNIDLLTCSTVEKVEGEAGNFRVTVKKRPRYINIDECTACGDCEQACPVEVPNEFNLGKNTRKAVYKLFPQAVPNKYAIEKRGTPPCRSTCPAGTNAQGYVALTSRGKFTEALEVVRRRMPFAAVCGRICHHPCEGECNRGQYDEPVAIQYLKRAASDFGEDTPSQVTEPKYGDRVAIVGGGPGGLAAALDLAREGFPVTVFEAGPRPGGMLVSGIPRYRLPEEAVKRDIGHVLSAGVEVKTNTRVGKDITFDQLRSEYKAVLISVGLQQSRMLAIEGGDLTGVLPAIPFLREAATGGRPAVGQRVLVIGGGNVAMDVARTALRLGAREVHVACLESRAEMPAHEWEIEEAVEEGIILHPSRGPKRFIGQNGRVTGLEVLTCRRVFDDEGRFNPQLVEGTEQTLPADTVIVAIGQSPDLSFLPADGSVQTRGPVIVVDRLTKETSLPGVFACGDVANGPASVVEAVGSAHEAAESIKRYLLGQDLRAGRTLEKEPKLGPPEKAAVAVQKRQRQAMAPVGERIKDFREVYLGFTREQAMEEAGRCLNCGICSECLQCEKACQKKAVEHWQQEEHVELEVGAVILTPGYELFDARLTGEYGYGIYPNVVTSMEFERFLSSTGPTAGAVPRPSDGKHPHRVAFIQCVGSRDCARKGAEYCSSICCMYSTKEAVIAREHDSNIEPTIFYLDIRSYGKNFDRYVESAKAGGVRYVQSMISRLREDPFSHNLFIQYVRDGEIVEEEFDLVVLAVGVQPPKAARELAETFGFALNEYNFAATSTLNPVQTSREGVFVAGVFQGPRDIPETVMNASAAAAAAGALLADVRGQRVRPKEYPPEKDVSGEEPRVGVFICHCGINIASVVNVPEVVEYARKLPGVAYAENNLYTCSQDTLKKIRDTIVEQHLNRVVVASCTIRTHQPLFREGLREAGLNQFLFEMANIRDQCSWVHRNEPDKATEKAKDLVRMAVAKVRTHEPLHLHPVEVVPSCLVVGGGVAGMTAALTLANQGYEAYLVEKEKELGGYVRHLHATLEGDDLQAALRDMIARVKSNPRIKVYTGAKIEDYGGHQGHFTTTISLGHPQEHVRKTEKLEHGAAIVATGAVEMPTSEYLYGQDTRVVTNTQMETELFSRQWDYRGVKQVVFIQCVGSRDSDHPYCSRTCCAQSVKNALKIKEYNPEIEVYILYRDMRTYGFMEKYYRQAREQGVIFIRYDEERGLQVRQREVGLLEVEVFDAEIGETIVLWPQRLVLATGAVAPEGIESLATAFKLPLNEDRFFVETHAKLGPIDFPTAGIFLAGAAHSPKLVSEAIYQAQGAVSRAATVLAQKYLMVGGVVAVVDQSKCAACLTCVRVCPYSVPRIGPDNLAEINAVQCQGCGTCAAECPAKAIQLQHYKDEQLLAKVAGLFA